MSLLSAHHVSQANALIHSAYLPSIRLHYNYARIIGALISPPYTFGTFISESHAPREGSALSYSLHLKTHSYTSTGAARRPRRLGGGKQSRHCPPRKGSYQRRGGREAKRREAGENRPALSDCFGTNHIIRCCRVKFQMTFKHVFFHAYCFLVLLLLVR